VKWVLHSRTLPLLRCPSPCDVLRPPSVMPHSACQVDAHNIVPVWVASNKQEVTPNPNPNTSTRFGVTTCMTFSLSSNPNPNPNPISKRCPLTPTPSQCLLEVTTALTPPQAPRAPVHLMCPCQVGARTLRPKITKLLPTYLTEFPLLDVYPHPPKQMPAEVLPDPRPWHGVHRAGSVVGWVGSRGHHGSL
jgi:hypothetical protein